MTHGARCDRTPAWTALERHHDAVGRNFDLRAAFASEPQRFGAFTLQAPEVFADLSKHRWSEITRKLLLQLARECGVEGKRDAMFEGEPINTTEGRAVLHTALRTPQGAPSISPVTDEAVAQVHEVLGPMLEFADRIRAQAPARYTDVVNIGIGGSDLGPHMAVLALDEFVSRDLRFHYVSNVDAHDIAPLLTRLDPAHTLFIVASKTFTTQETLANAEIAKAWFLEHGGQDVAAHFVGVTTNLEAAARFGVTTTFGFRDWVGGRYSVWSAIGLSLAIALGSEGFKEFLAGAHAMDEHFRTAAPESSLPLHLALIDVWYRDFLGFSSRCVAPYHQALARLPAYLQQLEMESNGKGVDLDGHSVPFGTSPVVWGEPGTNGQHAYFQMLHQGTDVVPVEFIAVKHPAVGHTGLLAASHVKLLANCLAQSQALMLGKTAEEAASESAPTAAPGLARETIAAHRSFPGNRPSTTLVLQALTPRSLGALIALYEHRVFCAGAIWGINSFDQWGVELGKALANALLPRFETGDAEGLDVSTAGLPVPPARMTALSDAPRTERAVVFDFGRVLFRWRPEAIVEQTLPHRIDAQRDIGHWVKEIFQAYRGDWQDFDRGTTDVPTLARRIATRTGLSEADVLAVVAAGPEELQPLPETVHWLRRLHAQGRPLHFLSNMPEPFAQALEGTGDFMSLFESGVFSARVQAVKPEPEIFEHAARTYRRVPQALLLVDDHLPNIVAARAAGWQGVHFSEVAQAEAEVRDLGW